MLEVTWPAALAWRLRRQLLEPVGTTSAADVVRTLGAVAAQLEPSYAELGVRARRRSARPGDLADAVATGAVVRTFAFRGAVHLMTPDQAAVHLALRTESRMWERASWQTSYALAPADWPALRETVRGALEGGPLTREELARHVTHEPRYRHLTAAFTDPSATFLKPFAWHGDLSLGPVREGRMTLQRLDTNPGWPGLPDVDEAGPRAIETYLAVYGPASRDNLHSWLTEGLGVRRRAVDRWLAALADRTGRTAAVSVDGEPRLVLRADLDELAVTAATPTVRLLPRYDQWVLGPGTADQRVVPAELRPAVSRGADLVVVGGVVAGTWSRTADGVATSWAAGAARPPQAAVDAEVARLGLARALA